MQFYLLILLVSTIFTQDNFCEIPNLNIRATYNIGDTLSIEDQLRPYEICFSSNEVEQDTFRFADFNGNLNGGDYKITLISMNASWWPACFDYISLMDEIIEFIDQDDRLEFLISFDFCTGDPLYTCEQWGNLYQELGDYGNYPTILNGDSDLDDDGMPDNHIWYSLANETYSAYALIDHHMVVRYLFDMPNYYQFLYNNIPILNTHDNNSYWGAWRSGIQQGLESPIIGYGPSSSRYHCKNLPGKNSISNPDSNFREPQWLPGLNYCGNHPHNFYIQLFAETGIIGLLIGIFMFGSIIYMCFKERLNYPDDHIISLAYIVPLALFFPIQQAGNFYGQWSNLFTWFAIGFAVSQCQSIYNR